VAAREQPDDQQIDCARMAEEHAADVVAESIDR
jgi:hypothetical protein